MTRAGLFNMTIDETVPIETKSLIQLLNCTFFPTIIPTQHHQLKNFISTRDPNFVYYASERNVFALNTKSRRQELIASLPWEPQCLDAGYGWICVGGSCDGRCAFISVGEEDYDIERDRGSTSGQALEVDALLPLDLDPGSRLLANNFLQRGQTTHVGGRRKPEVQIHEVGGSIVNSVTVHRLLSNQKGLEDEVVAVLTNNDETVRIFSLSQSRLLSQISFPTAMNHASISPDGNLLIAVGDVSQVFFCQRICLSNNRQPVDGEPNFARYEWRKIAEPKLSSAQPQDACFSTAFSPSGHVCAAASQAGVINIFDTSLIRGDMEGDDAVIEILKSSPCLGRDFGMIRSMSFAPPPWDLLAWAEDQGRVCVIDLRNSFRYKQTIELEINSPNLFIANIVESTDDHGMTTEQQQLAIEERFMQRHRAALDADDHIAAVSHATDYIELAAERRRIEREAREAGLPVFGEEFNLLTDNERQVLDSIRLSRLQDTEQNRAHTDSLFLNSLRSGSSSFASQNRANNSIRDYMRQRDLERTRPGDRSYQPRRRSSVVISNGSATNNSSSSHPSSLAPIGTATPTLSASPSRLNSSTVPSAPVTMSGDPWQTIIEAVAPSTSSLDATTRLRRERDAFYGMTDRATHQQASSIERSRNRPTNMTPMRSLHRITRQRAAAADGNSEEGSDIIRHTHTTRRRGEDGIGTMGIGWSRDGRNLYVATEEGILEYTVNIDERKTFPRIDLR